MTFLSFILSAVAVLWSSLFLLVGSRLMAGFFAGNQTISKAAVGNMLEGVTRDRAIGAFNIVGGLAWAIGSALGGYLLHFNLPKNVSFSLPFWVGGLAIFLVTMGVVFLFEEPHCTDGEKPENLTSKGNFFAQVRALAALVPLVIGVVGLMGWKLNVDFQGTYVIENYGFTDSGVGGVYSVIALSWSLGGILAVSGLLGRVGLRYIIATTLFVSGGAFFLLGIFTHVAFYWGGLVVSSLAQSVAGCGFIALFCRLTPKGEQGRIFGLWNSGLAMGSSLGPFIGGGLSVLSLFLPFWVSGSILIVCGFAFTRWALTAK